MTMALTDAACKAAKPKEKSYKLGDSGGLYLEIMPNGSKLWRLKYRYLKKEKRLAFGSFPLVKLIEAREKRDEAKKQLSNGLDPSDIKKSVLLNAQKNVENTFEKTAREWHAKQRQRWSEEHFNNVKHRLETDLFPHIGNDQIDKIETYQLLKVLTKIENRGALDIATRTRQLCNQVFRYAIQAGKCKHNPATDLQGALTTRKVTHFASIQPKEIPHLLVALERNDARLFCRTRRAIRLSMLTFVRPGEIRNAVWAEINFEREEWLIPAHRMKSRRDHVVPLCKQAIAILKEQKQETGHLNTDLIFPSQIKVKDPMSDGTVRLALQKLGLKDQMTAHGFRALARTTIREELDYEPDIIEVQLAHKPSGSLGAAYDRAQFLKKRKQMMQDWGDYLDKVLLKAKTDGTS